MKGVKSLKEIGVKRPRSNELLIVPTKKLLNWYKYEREV